MDGVMTKEFVFEEFKKLETNQQKAKYLRELKETKQKYPKSVSIKVSLKQFDNLIREYESLVPFGAMKREIAEREKAEAHIEMLKRKD